MFERFTNRARHVVVLSQEEARRLQHNYIGTEHILLGLLGEPDGVAGQALRRAGISLETARQDVAEIIGTGRSAPTGHIPFTPRAKKILELALREAVQLQHNYIGTEHILLGLIREGDGVGVNVLSRHTDPKVVRTTVLEMLPTPLQGPRGRRWLRRRASGAEPGESNAPIAIAQLQAYEGEQTVLSATPAADTTLSEAARLAGAQPVGSHHLLLAALADADSAAAKALQALGLDLDQAKEALRVIDVTGTSDEQPEDAGRRQMIIRVTDDRLTIEAADPVIIEVGRAALQALGDQANPANTIRGSLPACVGLSTVWQAMHDGLVAIQRRAALPDSAPDNPENPENPENLGKAEDAEDGENAGNPDSPRSPEGPGTAVA
jgi:ATP-dependent Clp protease ATP-binding subunit ClpA